MRLLHIGARARWKGVSCVIILHKRNESRGNEDSHAAGLRRQPGGGATGAHPWRRSTTHRRRRHPSPGGSAIPCPAATLRPAATPRLALPRQLASPRGRATSQAPAAAAPAPRHHRACRLGWRRWCASGPSLARRRCRSSPGGGASPAPGDRSKRRSFRALHFRPTSVSICEIDI